MLQVSPALAEGGPQAGHGPLLPTPQGRVPLAERRPDGVPVRGVRERNRTSASTAVRVGYDGHKRRNGSKVHAAVDTLGHLLALRVAAASDQVAALAAEVQAVCGQAVKVAFVDQGYTGTQPAADAANHGIELVVVAHAEPKRGFVLLPRRWVVERTFGWLARFRRLTRDYERLADTLAGWHWVAFVTLLLHRIRPLLVLKCITASSPQDGRAVRNQRDERE